ncbi:MAG: hypothetical protein JXB10_16890 [Pirellulales bacterium]|nr:hypothetical protein [Pirellulales bacterium]
MGTEPRRNAVCPCISTVTVGADGVTGVPCVFTAGIVLCFFSARILFSRVVMAEFRWGGPSGWKSCEAEGPDPSLIEIRGPWLVLPRLPKPCIELNIWLFRIPVRPNMLFCSMLRLYMFWELTLGLEKAPGPYSPCPTPPPVFINPPWFIPPPLLPNSVPLCNWTNGPEDRPLVDPKELI